MMYQAPVSLSLRPGRRARVATGVAVLALIASSVLHPGVPASAASHTWRARVPSLSGTVYSEPAASRGIARKGVSAQLEASGPLFRTTVSLGSAYSSGSNAANISNSTHSNLLSKVKFVFLPRPSDKGKVALSATITGVSGMRSIMPAPQQAGDVSGLDLASLAEAGIRTQSLEILTREPNVSYWRGDTAAGDVALVALTKDGFTSSTAASPASMRKSGVTMRVDTETVHEQALIAPEGLDLGDTLNASGLREIVPGFFINATPPKVDERIVVPLHGEIDMSRSAAAKNNEFVLTLFGDPRD
jgi:hypothetical protein